MPELPGGKAMCQSGLAARIDQAEFMNQKVGGDKT
jgi:hypothetical protein